VRALLGPQGPEVVERLAVFPVIADALDSGDLSRLDPLPPEQREFALEVLKRSDALGPEVTALADAADSTR
jgi:hypothetical protein